MRMTRVTEGLGNLGTLATGWEIQSQRLNPTAIQQDAVSFLLGWIQSDQMCQRRPYAISNSAESNACSRTLLDAHLPMEDKSETRLNL